jgi:hypothetical protein
MSTTEQSHPSKRNPARQRTASDQVMPALLRAAETVLDRDGERGGAFTPKQTFDNGITLLLKGLLAGSEKPTVRRSKPSTDRPQ